MKRLLLLLTTFIFALNSCQEEEAIQTQEQIQFTLGVTAADASGGRVATTLPDNISVMITLNDRNGQPVFTNKRITLLKMGPDYITEPIALKSGHYTLTHFMLVDESSEVLYATPQKNSKLAAIVQRSLPYTFSVSRNNVRNIPIEVVEVGARQPGDFGYAAFLVGVSYPIEISVFIQNGSTLELTEARAYIFENGSLFSEHQLKAKVNLISFRGDPEMEYRMEIQKDGYKTWSRTFTYRQLEAEMNAEGPLKVILGVTTPEPGPAIVITPGQGYFSMWIGFKEKGSVNIDMGNGEVETFSFDVDPEDETGTGYAYRDGTYPGTIPQIKITGDIHLVTSFAFDNATSINGEYAPALNEVSFLNSAVTLLDLEHNNEMRYLAFDASFADEIILPQQHAITTLYVGGEWPNQASLDYMIENIHVNTVAGGRREGSVTLSGATISDESVSMLEEMRDDYDWIIDF